MEKRNHVLTDREMNDINNNGLVDKYREFSDSDFSDEFVPLEQSDYEIRASQNNVRKEECMKDTRKASYVGELTSGYDATVQDDYESGHGDKGQKGKGHEEEVAAKNNWIGDKRDAIGRAATVSLLRKMAVRLNKKADEMEGEDEDGFDDDEEIEDLENVDEGDDGDELEDVVASVIDESKTASKKVAVHPEEHDPKKDDPGANMSSQTGDEEWIDIGPGEFDDPRDEVGRADEGK